MKIIHAIRENKVRIIFALLLAAVLGIDARREATSLAETLITNQLLGVAVCTVVASCYGFRNLLKPYYVLVTLLGIAGTIFGGWYWFGHQTSGYIAYYIMIPLNIWFLLIAWGLLIEHAFLKKDVEFRLAKWEIVVVVCMVAMTLSVNEAFWPMYDLLLILPLWHAPYSREDKIRALEGTLDGVILGFFLIQSFAYYNRPYDVLRYVGTWHGSNMNALFYLETLIAIAGKYYLSRLRYRKMGSKVQKFWIVWHWLFLAGTVDFILFTMGRTALGVAGILILLLGLIADMGYLKDQFRWVTLRAFLFGLVILVGLPVVYWTIRYIPAYCDHPLYWSGEWSEAKVQPRSSVDDSRYIDFETALEAMFGRFVGPDGIISFSRKESAEGGPTKVVSVDDTALGNVVTRQEEASQADMDASGEDPSGEYLWTFEAKMLMAGKGATVDYSGTYGYKLIPKPSNISMWGRLVVYKLYLSNLNLIGHRDYDSYFEVQGFQIYHGHNLLVYYMYMYGVPAGGLAVGLMFWALICSIRLLKKKRPEALVYLLYYALHLIFGIFEAAFFPGQAILFFTIFLPFFLRESAERSLWEEYLPE